MRKSRRKTLLRRGLNEDSDLLPSVAEGMGAILDAHRNYFNEKIRTSFEDSLDLDAAMRKGREGEHRWDYLLGHRPSSEVIAVEPHSAKQDEITTVIKKQASAKQQLHGHLRDGVRIKAWLWVSSGSVYFADTERVRRQLDQKGIQFAGSQI